MVATQPIEELIPIEEPKTEEPKMREITLPEEPSVEDPDSLELIFRMPLSGERVRRRFLKTDTISLLYDFIDSLQASKQCQFEGVNSFTDQY